MDLQADVTGIKPEQTFELANGGGLLLQHTTTFTPKRTRPPDRVNLLPPTAGSGEREI